jgi:hypothetical protein
VNELDNISNTGSLKSLPRQFGLVLQNLDEFRRPPGGCSRELDSIFRFLTNLDDLDSATIFPVLKPNIEQARIVCLHELKASVAIFLQPTVQVVQSLRQHPAFPMETFVNFPFRSGSEMLDDHVQFHVRDAA